MCVNIVFFLQIFSILLDEHSNFYFEKMMTIKTLYAYINKVVSLSATFPYFIMGVILTFIYIPRIKYYILYYRVLKFNKQFPPAKNNKDTTIFFQIT